MPHGVEEGVRAEELAGWLAVIGVDEATVAGVRLGAESDGSWCVRAVPDGPETDESEEEPWEIFWCEQGGRYEWMRFPDEATACFALFGRLVWAHAVRSRAARDRAGIDHADPAHGARQARGPAKR